MLACTHVTRLRTMTQFPYAQTKKSLKGTIDKIPIIGVPEVVDAKFLASIGYGNSNDLRVIGVLRFIGFLDTDSRPTQLWQAYRNPHQAKSIMADAIRTAYTDLFAQRPHAEVVNSSDLTSFFAAHTKAGTDVVRKSVSTFVTLCEYADFASQPSSGYPEVKPAGVTNGSDGRQQGNGIKPPSLPDQQPALHIDVQIHISPSADADQIDNIFRSMAKHLYSTDAN